MIFVCGDPHQEFDHIVNAVLEHSPDAVILLGDITPLRPLEIELELIKDLTEIWWIHGNHDTDHANYFDNLFGSKLADRNLHGRIVDIVGVRVAGMGGIFRSKIWTDGDCSTASPESYLKTCSKAERWRDGLPLRHRSSIFPSEIQALSKHTADVLVTHEAPKLHPYGSTVLSELAKSLSVSAAFHGHHHEDIQYAGGVWRGVGLRGIVTLDGEVIQPGEVVRGLGTGLKIAGKSDAHTC